MTTTSLIHYIYLTLRDSVTFLGGKNMKTLFITLFLINTSAFANLAPDIIVPSHQETIFGQRLISGEAQYTDDGTHYSDPPSTIINLAKSDAMTNALRECESTSDRVSIRSPWTIHKVVSCNDIVCYGAEYGKYVATALFECSLGLRSKSL